MRPPKPMPIFAALMACLATPGFAQDAVPSADSGDTAWMITATALVLMMTIPGLALFYAGMVRVKNALSMLMQCFAITALISVLWMIYGYSLAFDTTGMAAGTVNLHSFVGGLHKAFMAGITSWGRRSSANEGCQRSRPGGEAHDRSLTGRS